MPDAEKKFSETLVGDVYELIVRTPTSVREDAQVREVIDGMLSNPLSRKVYVVDGQGKLKGIITTETILRLIGYRTGVRQTGAASFYRFLRDMFKEDVIRLMTSTRSVTREDKLTTAMDIMLRDHVNDLPVVDADGRLVGELISLELFLKGKELFEREESE
jgi:CBS domain-containing protein